MEAEQKKRIRDGLQRLVGHVITEVKVESDGVWLTIAADEHGEYALAIDGFTGNGWPALSLTYAVNLDEHEICDEDILDEHLILDEQITQLAGFRFDIEVARSSMNTLVQKLQELTKRWQDECIKERLRQRSR